jgi:bacterioferritin
MQGNPQIIDTLNALLMDELTATNEYVVHANVAENWGYAKLAEVDMGRAKDEMNHIDNLIERIVFLEGVPVVSKLGAIHIGAVVPQQIDNDAVLETTAIQHYNDAVKLCVSLGDDGTREIIEGNLRTEEDHLRYLEGQQTQIRQMGLSNFLANQ